VSVSEADLRRIDLVVSRNREALELVAEAVAKTRCVFPPTAGLDRGQPGVQETLNVLARISCLSMLNYVRARSWTYHRRWRDGLGTVTTLLRFGFLLGSAWNDLALDSDGEFAKRDAYLAMVEMAFQRDADAAVVREAIELVERSDATARVFIESSLGPFWGTVFSFLGGIGDSANAWAVIDSLLRDAALRSALTEPRLLNWDLGDLAKRQPSYPAVLVAEEATFGGDSLVSAASWISERCGRPFDKVETMRFLEERFAILLAESAKEPHAFRKHLDLAASSQAPSYHLAAVLRAAATRSLFHVKKAVAGVPGGEIGAAGGSLPQNVIGMALAADVISAVQSNLSTRWSWWQRSLLTREVCRALLALLQYTRSFRALPHGLEDVVACGYLKSLPCDPYSGNALGYSAEEKKVYVDETTSTIGRFVVPDDEEKPEWAWYLNI
jgi:hypothetical protein